LTAERTRIEGSCHCGNIRFELHWPGAAEDIVLRRCGCTFCRMRTGSWTSHVDARLDATLGDPQQVSRYRFGTGTADFHVCSICGVVPFVTSEIEGRLYAVVNVLTFRNVYTTSLECASTDFDGEATGDRLDRRKRNWIPDVRVSSSPPVDR
jgi:hypothetical protein